MRLISLVFDKNCVLKMSCDASHCSATSFLLIKMQFSIQVMPTKIILLSPWNTLYKLVEACFRFTLLDSTSSILAGENIELLWFRIRFSTGFRWRCQDILRPGVRGGGSGTKFIPYCLFWDEEGRLIKTIWCKKSQCGFHIKRRALTRPWLMKFMAIKSL